jgi:L-aspartate oxidase
VSEVIVVGSGIAGLIAALETSHKHAVTLITKAELSESNTRYAQGGIAAALFEDDSVAEHVADTLRAGAGLSDPSVVEVLCSEGPARVRDLIRLGVAFDRHNGELARGLEAAHSRPRVLHAGGDATGFAIESALVHAIRGTGNITILEHTFVKDLLVHDGRVAGVEILDADNKPRSLHADAVVLASGGAGQIYLHTSNPSVATGDGIAIALRAGAELADVEFYQFHPTTLAVPGNFLISEALRGDGAVLLDAEGHRFMKAVHPDAELAPRDVVARGIAEQMAAQNGAPVFLDASALGADFLKERFPTIDAACRTYGFDWASQPVPVTPAAHYWMGGVRTDEWGRTSLPGLFAVGEVACTGVHGANRLASNSLLESLVFAWRCASLLSNEEFDSKPWPVFHDEATVLPLQQEVASATSLDRKALQTLMWEAVGIYREAGALQRAAKQLCLWKPQGTTASDYETANLLDLARVMVAAAAMREESRGAHWRNDFPETSPRFQHHQYFRRDGGAR